MKKSIHDHFDESVDDYNTVADKVVFKNQELHDVILNITLPPTSSQLNVLDIGCGTGSLLHLFAEKHRSANLTGIDYSSRMLTKARKHLAKHASRVNLILLDINDFHIEEKQDVIISSMTIHNLSHNEKDCIFKKIFEYLNPGGIFINADFYAIENDLISTQISDLYKEYVSKNLQGKERDLWLEHIRDDRPMTLSHQYKSLQKAGFQIPKIQWLFLNEAVYSAKKPKVLT